MPTSRRMASICLRSSVSSVPSTMIVPCWCSSSLLMQRIMVDFPDPDGPQITMRSPGATFRSMLRSTWNCPYHLLTLSMRIMASAIRKLLAVHVQDADCGPLALTLITCLQLLFQMLAVPGYRKAENEIDDTDEQIGFGAIATPGG